MKIVIVGAGVAGLSAAWRLAKAGAQVVVLERAQPARGATYACAGMIAVAAEAGAMPPAEAAFARQSRAMWPDFAAALEAESGIGVAYRRDGALLTAADAGEAQSLMARAEDTATVFLGAEEARAKAPMLTADISGALWAAEDAQVDNRALGRALTSAALGAGAILSANEAAVRVETARGGGLSVRTPFGFHEADTVLLAAGAWLAQIAGLPAVGTIPVRPVKGEIVALESPSPDALPLPLLWGRGVYLVPRGRRLLVGATVEEAGFDTRPTGEGRDWLLARATALMPALKDWRISEHWAGLRPASGDGLPIIGESAQPGLFVAGGQYRNGILFAPAIAQAVEQCILGTPSTIDIGAFSPRRFRS